MADRWRRQARAVIDAMDADPVVAKLPTAERLKHIQAAYPFGIRYHHPYTIWCDEIRLWKARQMEAGNPLRADCPRCGAWKGRKCRERAGDALPQKQINTPHPERASLARALDKLEPLGDGPMFEGAK